MTTPVHRVRDAVRAIAEGEQFAEYAATTQGRADGGQTRADNVRMLLNSVVALLEVEAQQIDMKEAET